VEVFTSTTGSKFDCSQCPVYREPVRSLPQRLDDGPVGSADHTHTVHYSFHGQLDHPCLRNPSCRHSHSKSHGGLRIRTYHWAHTGLYLLLSFAIRNSVIAAKPMLTNVRSLPLKYVCSLRGGNVKQIHFP
jgi:hypothetical protein